jgi:hypothetical protein
MPLKVIHLSASNNCECGKSSHENDASIEIIKGILSKLSLFEYLNPIIAVGIRGPLTTINKIKRFFGL